jgi:Transglutaminase-like superfamily
MVSATPGEPVWSPQLDMFVHELVRRIAAMQLQPQGHNVCLEIATVGAKLAAEMGIDATPEVGMWRALDGRRVPHAWLSVKGRLIIHSRRYINSEQAIEIEVLPVSDAFQAQPRRAA